MKLRIVCLLVLFVPIALPLAAQVGGNGTTDYIPIWTTGTTLGDSAMFQTNGMMGIGTTSPTATLTVLGANGNCFSSTAFQINVGIGTTTPAHTLEVGPGGTTLADAWTTRSSRRFKTNIQPLEGALERVEQLQGVSYERKADGKHEIGVVAEDVDHIVQEVVSRDPETNEIQGVDYSRLAALLIEAVKSQQAEIKQLKAQIEQLTSNPRIDKR